MTDVKLFGAGASPYVRTCMIALAVKGVAFDHDQAMPQSPKQKARHPWGKIPAFAHRDVTLFETSAICRYVDAAFAGPALQPSDIAARAVMEQWISGYNAYFYQPAVMGIVIQRVVLPQADEAQVAASVPKAAHALAAFDAALARTPYFASGAPSIADYLVLPLANYLAVVPEGPALFAPVGHVRAWQARMNARPSAAAAKVLQQK
ncbi:MAG: glutathione S-transferase family protein [Alphaproteobacteria bacterium]|nr:glutathione S-transferase family protein [Alphaproteobacteria bacterium]